MGKDQRFWFTLAVVIEVILTVLVIFSIWYFLA